MAMCMVVNRPKYMRLYRSVYSHGNGHIHPFLVLSCSRVHRMCVKVFTFFVYIIINESPHVDVKSEMKIVENGRTATHVIYIYGQQYNGVCRDSGQTFTFFFQRIRIAASERHGIDPVSLALAIHISSIHPFSNTNTRYHQCCYISSHSFHFHWPKPHMPFFPFSDCVPFGFEFFSFVCVDFFFKIKTFLRPFVSPLTIDALVFRKKYINRTQSVKPYQRLSIRIHVFLHDCAYAKRTVPKGDNFSVNSGFMSHFASHFSYYV